MFERVCEARHARAVPAGCRSSWCRARFSVERAELFLCRLCTTCGSRSWAAISRTMRRSCSPAWDVLRNKGWDIPQWAVREGLRSVHWPASLRGAAAGRASVHRGRRPQPAWHRRHGGQPQAAVPAHEGHVCIRRHGGQGRGRHFATSCCRWRPAVLPVRPDSPRAMEPAALAERIGARGVRAEACETVAEGVHRAMDAAGRDGVVVRARLALYGRRGARAVSKSDGLTKMAIAREISGGREDMDYLSDIEIAQRTAMQPIVSIAAEAGIDERYLEQYGRYKAKVDPRLMRETPTRKGKLILVTAITPTPAGEGKTTTTIGLADGLRRIGKRAMVALREPSLGPGVRHQGRRRRRRICAGGCPWKISTCTLPAIFTPSARPTTCWRPCWTTTSSRATRWASTRAASRGSGAWT